MGCIKKIRSDLAPSFPSGGVWTYVGFSPSSGGPFTGTPFPPLVPFMEGQILVGEGDNFNIDSTGADEGYYKFTYAYGGDTIELVIKVEEGNVGADVAVTYDVSDDGPYDLTSLIATTDSGGVWTDVDGSGEDEAAFVPSNLFTGTYRFKYSLIDSGYINAGCTDCKLEGTVTVTIVDSFTATVTVDDSACTYSMALEEPKIGTANTLLLSVSSGVSRVTGQIDRVVSNDCGSPEVTDTISFQSSEVYSQVTLGEPFITGSTVTSLTLANAAGGTEIVPLAPGTAIISGSYGNTTDMALIYDTANPHIFSNALKIATYNYLMGEGYLIGDEVNLIDFTYDTSHNITIRMGVKHNPSGDWLGLGKGVSSVSYIAATPETESVTALNWQCFGGSFYVTLNYSLGSCGTLSASFSALEAAIVDDSGSDFDTIDLTGASYVVTPTTTPVACTGKTLTVVALNCSGSLSYLWNTGATTDEITVLPGFYSVDVSCDSETITVNVDAT